MTGRVVVLEAEPAPLAAFRWSGVLDGFEVAVVPAGAAPEGYEDTGTVVVDGPAVGWSDLAVADLRRAVERGTTLVTTRRGLPLAERLNLVATGEHLPAAEYAIRVLDPQDALVRRRPAETLVHDAPAEITPRAGLRPLLATSVHFRDRVIAAAGRLGAGRVLVLGGAEATPALASEPYRTLVRRSITGAQTGNPVRVGIVGYGPFGGMGYAHGLALAATPGLQLAAVVDPVAERRAAAAEMFPGLHAHADLAGLLAGDEIDLAIVATPPVYHAGLCADLLRAGKHVVCEKPLCLTTAEADGLLELAADTGRALTVHHNRRFDADFIALTRAVRDGLLGDLFNVETFVGGFQHPCRAWHSEVAMSGGAVYDWGSHHVDWILRLLGDRPVGVTMTTHKRVWRDVTNDDQLRLRLLFADGREAEFLQSDVAAVRRPKFYVQGTRGTAVGWYREMASESIEPGLGFVRRVAHHAEAPVDLRVVRYEGDGVLTDTTIAPRPGPAHAFHANLADHLEFGEPLAVTAQSARDVIAVLEAGTRSAAAGGAVVTPG